VSLLWRDEVRIALAPERVVLARVARGLRPKLIASEVVPCVAAEARDWRTCIDVLRQTLEAPRWHSAAATVILSNHFVRYALVPWSEHLVTDAEKAAWVRHHFEELYDAPAAPLEYRWSDEQPGQPCVASAVDAEFLNRLRTTLEAASLRLQSLQPYLMAAINRWRHELGKGPVWLVLPESGRLCVAALADGAWRSITSKSTGAQWQAELPLLLERQLALSADDEAPSILLYWPETSAVGLGALSNLPLRLLEPRNLRGWEASANPLPAMALAGVL
jgi:hypothetical protein